MPDYSMFCVHYPENSGHYRYPDESAYPDVLGGALTVPVPTQLIRLAMAGRAAARRLYYRELIRDLEPSSITALEQLLTERAGERSLLGWIAEAPEGGTQKSQRNDCPAGGITGSYNIR